ncbi:unnamed protein product, partial [Symbiodinium microadriaticum]
MWYVAVQAVQEVINTSDPDVSRKLTCITANVTQWRKEVATWLFELGPDVAAVQETHLGQAEIRQVQIDAGKAGYQFQAVPAGQGKGAGTLGGVAILTKNHLGARLVDSFVTKEGCGWIAVALRVHGRDLILFSLYLQSGVGPTGGCNPEVLASTLSQLQGPKVEMTNLALVAHVKGKLVGPVCPTAGGLSGLVSQLKTFPVEPELGMEREGGCPLATLEGKKKGGCDGWSYAALRNLPIQMLVHEVALLPKDEHKE